MLINTLSQSPEISVTNDLSMLEILASGENIQEASMSTSKVDDLVSGIQVKSQIWGDFILINENLIINLKLIDKESNRIFITLSEETHPDSLLIGVSRLSERIRNNLEIKSYEQDLQSEFGEFARTNSAEAYRHYLDGFRYTILCY